MELQGQLRNNSARNSTGRLIGSGGGVPDHAACMTRNGSQVIPIFYACGNLLYEENYCQSQSPISDAESIAVFVQAELQTGIVLHVDSLTLPPCFATTKRNEKPKFCVA